MNPLLWPALLLLIGLALLMLEVFVPSGGILGFLSIAAMAASIVLAFYFVGAQTGFGMLLVAAVAIPSALMLAFRWLPRTPMGRRMLPDLPSEEEVLPDSPQRRALRELIGRTGRAVTKMLPSGAVEVDEQVIDAVSEGPPIDLGQAIEVVEVHGTRVVVRELPEKELRNRPGAAGDDILSRPIDSLGLDPFDDPLA